MGIEHKKMTINSIVEDLVELTGGNASEIEKILLDHKVAHGFTAYRYMKNIEVIFREKDREILSEISHIKEERIQLEGSGKDHEIAQITQKLERARGNRDLMIPVLKTINYFYETLLGRLDKEESFIEQIEKSNYKEVGKIVRKRAEKLFKRR